MERRLFEEKLARFPKSKIWDKSTQISVDAVRSFIHRHPQPTISHIQKKSLQERPLKAPFHLIPDILPAPKEDDVEQLLCRTIDALGNIEYERPDLVSVPVEWIGRKIHSCIDRVEQSLHKRSGLRRLVKDSENDLTILHVHGGGFFQGSPRSYRPTTSQLASLSGGRVVSVEYRLSPQNVFPAAILDVLVVYMSLLYPSSASPHEAVDASRVVFAGDSAGGVLLLCVLQILLHAVSHTPIHFHEHSITTPLPKPAGIAVLSLPGDFVHSLPSFEGNRAHDLFLEVPWHQADYPSCPLWPASPPRPDIYCPTMSFLHPLVTLALVKSWAGAPSMWLASGEEVFADGAKAVARRAARDSINVTWTEYEAMPHCFPSVPGLTKSKQSLVLMERWASFCKDCANGAFSDGPRAMASKVSFPDAKEQATELETIADLSLEIIESRIKAKVHSLDQEFRQQLSQVTQPKL